MPLTTVDQGLLSTNAQYTGFKNRIINGDMQIDQRNNGASVTLTSANGVYAVDRFESYANTDGTVTAQRVTDAPAGFVNSLRHTTTTADSSLSAAQRVQVVQKIEGFNVADFGLGTASAVTFTVSFWVKSSLTGTFGGSMINGGYTRSYPFSYTINSANTWEQKSITIAGDTSGTWLTNNERGLILTFGLGVGSNFVGTANTWQTGEFLAPAGAVSVVGTLNATWQVTGVQLEKGQTATSFDVLDYGTELMLCQRYLPAFIRGPANAYVGTGWIYNSTNAAIYVPFQVAARTNPTGVTATGVFTVDSTIAATVSSITLSTPAIFGTTLVATTSTTMTAGYGCGLVMLNSSTQVLFTGCEL
jgi:hypothetical protein